MKRKDLKIGPTPGDDFEMLLFVLTLEVSHARLHLQIARQIGKASADRPQILHTAPTFFSFTFRAHLESAYTRAARLFDPTDGTATVSSMVRASEKKAGTFQHAKASEVRNKIKIWDSRIQGVQPILTRLHDLRNGLIAHLDAGVILNSREMTRTIGVTFDEVEQILDTAKFIVRDALDAYNNSIYADELESAKDWDTLLRILGTPGGKPSTVPISKPPDLDIEQIEMLANFNDCAFDHPELTFEEVAKKLGVDFSKAKNGKAWEAECREVFDKERLSQSGRFRTRPETR